VDSVSWPGEYSVILRSPCCAGSIDRAVSWILSEYLREVALLCFQWNCGHDQIAKQLKYVISEWENSLSWRKTRFLSVSTVTFIQSSRFTEYLHQLLKLFLTCTILDIHEIILMYLRRMLKKPVNEFQLCVVWSSCLECPFAWWAGQCGLFLFETARGKSSFILDYELNFVMTLNTHTHTHTHTHICVCVCVCVCELRIIQ
jgi:hypothetical protein